MNLAFGTSAKKDARIEATILADVLKREAYGGIKGRSIYGAQIRYRICDDFVTHYLIPVLKAFDDSKDAYDTIPLELVPFLYERLYASWEVQQFKQASLIGHKRLIQIMRDVLHEMKAILEAGGAQGSAGTMNLWCSLQDIVLRHVHVHGSGPMTLPAIPGCHEVLCQVSTYVDDLAGMERIHTEEDTTGTPASPKCVLCDIDDTEPAILCDECNRTHHTECIATAANRRHGASDAKPHVPAGDWYCHECECKDTPLLNAAIADIATITGVDVNELRSAGHRLDYPTGVAIESWMRGQGMGRNSQAAAEVNAVFGVAASINKALTCRTDGQPQLGTVLTAPGTDGRLGAARTTNVPADKATTHLGVRAAGRDCTGTNDRDAPARTTDRRKVSKFRATTTMNDVDPEVFITGVSNHLHNALMNSIRVRVPDAEEIETLVDHPVAEAMAFLGHSHFYLMKMDS